MTAEADSGPKPWAKDAAAIDGEVVVQNRQHDLTVDGSRWAALMRGVLAAEGVTPPWEAGLSFVAVDEMTALNAQYRGIHKPTDVLAFGTDDGSVTRAEDEPRLVGDVVICPSVAASNAAARDQSVEDELALLVVHGALHLLGYDHVDDGDAAIMESREQKLLAAAAAMSEAVAGTAATTASISAGSR